MFGKSASERKAARELEAMRAAADYLLAAMNDDEPRIDDAIGRVDAPMLQAAVIYIAQRAVSALAQLRGTPVDEVMASLAELPPKT